MNRKILKEFILEASQNTYASEDSDIKVRQEDGSTTIVYEKDDWKYHDNYFGGEPFGGREVVFLKEKAIWMMVYYGSVVVDEIVPDELYKVLTKALRNSTIDMPYRGPKELVEGDFRYENDLEGDVERFSGEERIYKNDSLLYSAKYVGGVL
jgi:hypothetical protein